MNNAQNLVSQKYLKCILFFLVVLFITCKKEGHEKNLPTIEDTAYLNKWYDNLIQQHQKSFFAPRLIPDWSSIHQNKHGDKMVYEVTCKNPQKLISGSELTTDTKKLAEIETTTIKLLIFKDSKNCLTGAFMLISGDQSSVKTNRYKNLPDFTGKVLYYTLSGEFANGWLYTNGTITHSIANVTTADLPSQKNTSGNSVFNRGEKLMLENISCVVSAQPVYSYQCISASNEQGTIISTTCAWILVDMDYVIQCTSNGGSDGGSSGGGGYIPPTTPPTVPEDAPKPDPCAKAKTLNENTNYKNETNDLKDKVADLNLKREVGYIKKVGSPAIYSDPGSTGMLFNIPQINELNDHSLEYITHSHYIDPSALSIFSFDDFFTFGKFLGSNKVADVNTFNLGVATNYGTYALVLDDSSKFISYLQTTINDLQGSIDLFQKFDSPTIGILETNSGSINETNFLKIIKDSGIKLLKKDQATGNFKVLTLDSNGNLIIINCSGNGSSIE